MANKTVSRCAFLSLLAFFAVSSVFGGGGHDGHVQEDELKSQILQLQEQVQQLQAQTQQYRTRIEELEAGSVADRASGAAFAVAVILVLSGLAWLVAKKRKKPAVTETGAEAET